MEDIKTFEEVRQDMEVAYNEYLKTGEEDRLWELCHQVLSNALFVLNEEETEDIFTYEFPEDTRNNRPGRISRLLNVEVGHIAKVCTIPADGVVWFITEDGQEYDDDSSKLAIWEIYNIAVALYLMTEPLADLLYK